MQSHCVLTDTLALVYEYARLIDNRRFDDLIEIICEDVHIGTPDRDMNSFAEWRNALNFMDTYLRTFHLVGNHTGAWSGDEFQGETYCVASHLYKKADEIRKHDMGIRYQDRIVRQQGRLKFKERILDVVWTQDLPANCPGW